MTSQEEIREAILATERDALDRWYSGDPSGYLDRLATEATYFDSWTSQRLDGIGAIKAWVDEAYGEEFEGLAKTPLRYEIVNPTVEAQEDMALLTFNLDDYQASGEPGGRWNVTEFYRLTEGQWKVVHAHWTLRQKD